MANKINYIYSIEMKVRDYECDLQGVVNNSNYQRYMEHARHEFWLEIGEGFADMHEQGLDAFVYKVTLTYKDSLRSGDKFTSQLTCHRKGPKLIFDQAIIKENGTVSAEAEIEVVAVQNGQLTRGEYFDQMIQKIAERFPNYTV